MTQTDRVLSMLRSAGQRGVRSDQFFAAHMPRGAARIKDLRDQGYEISSEREGKYVRYRIAGEGSSSRGGGPAPLSGADGQGGRSVAPAGRERAPGLCGDASEPQSIASDSGEVKERGGEEARTLSAVSPERSVPSHFDYDAFWDDAA